MTPEQQLHRYLLSRDVAPLWADGALRVLQTALSTNTYFTKSLHVQDLTLHPKESPLVKGHKVKRLALMATLNFPDTYKERPAIFVYTFDRKRKMPHQVKVHYNVTKSTFIPV